MEPEKTQNCQNNPEEKEQIKRYNPPDFRQYYKATVIKTLCCCHQNRHMDQQNRREIPEINPHPYHQLFFRGDTYIQWTETTSSASGVGEVGQSHVNQ